jgi:hypothetical protein
MDILLENFCHCLNVVTDFALEDAEPRANALNLSVGQHEYVFFALNSPASIAGRQAQSRAISAKADPNLRTSSIVL